MTRRQNILIREYKPNKNNVCIWQYLTLVSDVNNKNCQIENYNSVDRHSLRKLAEIQIQPNSKI